MYIVSYKDKEEWKTKSAATSKTKFALIILIFIHKLSFKKDKKQQRFIKIYWYSFTK